MIDPLSAWLVSFLEHRNLTNPNGRNLFSYNLSKSEYETLREKLSETITNAGGLEPLASRSRYRQFYPPAAAFVLYASEWWRREYAGGAWSWNPVLDKLGNLRPSAALSDFVTVGLSFWGLEPQSRGKRFIGAIAANGGIPMRLLAQGGGRVDQVMSQVLKLASRYRWESTQVLEAVNERLNLLPRAYRQPAIAELLAQCVDATLLLREEFQKKAVGEEPLKFLDTSLPDWRSSFPISLEDDAALTLLTGLVREAAAQNASFSRGLFIAERRLIEESEGCFSLEAHLVLQGESP